MTHYCSCFALGMVWGGVVISGGIMVLAVVISAHRRWWACLGRFTDGQS